MKKKLLMILVVAITIISMFTLVACGGNGGNTTPNDNTTEDTDGNNEDSNNSVETKTQLSIPTNINYTKDGYKFTWDVVVNADSYNIKVTSEGLFANDIRTNEFGYYPQDSSKDIKVQVQAVDSTGKYSKSEWSDEYSYTIEIQESLMTSVMNYARENVNGELKNFVSARVNDSILVLNVITRRNGEDKITEILSDINKGVDTTSLAKVIESNPTMYSSRDYTLAVDDNGKAYNSMQYLLKSNLQGTKLQRWKDNGFNVEVLSSNTALNYNDPEGNDFTVHTILKLTNGNDVRYFEVEYGCHNKYPSNLEENVTYSLQNTSDRSISEGVMHEITGDYLDVLIQNTTAKTQVSYYSNNEGMSY